MGNIGAQINVSKIGAIGKVGHIGVKVYISKSGTHWESKEHGSTKIY